MQQLPEARDEYTPEERAQLVALAHRAIEEELRGQSVGVSSPSAHLGEARGAFTSLHLEGKLRGCIGYVEPMFPLYQAVAETARSAAFEDPRFVPVTLAELPKLKIQISVMSPLMPIRPEEVEVGKHGLIISRGARRGLLLPQVATEWGWNREEFLSQTCRKAGLPMDAWKEGATIEAFTAEVFGEE